jgi:hypothetical protein
MNSIEVKQVSSTTTTTEKQSFTTSTKENFKLKLKAMRCRIKQKHKEFLQMSSFNALTTTYLEKHYGLFKPSEQQENGDRLKVKLNQKKSESTTSPKEMDTFSIEISFSTNQANLEQNSKNSSRTSTPILKKQPNSTNKKSIRFTKKQRYSIRADVRNSTILIHQSSKSKSNRKSASEHLIYSPLVLRKTERSKTHRFKRMKFFDFKQNDIYNYAHVANPLSPLSSCSQCNYCEDLPLNENRFFFQSTESPVVPCAFEEFGDFKVWYV